MVAVFCEGPTEWYVIYQLNKRTILHGDSIEGGDTREDISHWLKRPEDITNDFLDELPDFRRMLFVFDQEHNNSPDDIMSQIVHQCPGLNIHTISEYSNVFIGLYQSRRVALFIANADSPDGNKDFDGYIVQLVERLGSDTVKLWFEDARNSHDDRLPGYLRNLRTINSVEYEVIHSLGSADIPNIMEQRNWPIQRSKTKLYAYITALQLNKSHVWFSEKLVKWAPDQVLQEIFAPLIKAWKWLVEENE